MWQGSRAVDTSFHDDVASITARAALALFHCPVIMRACATDPALQCLSQRPRLRAFSVCHQLLFVFALFTPLSFDSLWPSGASLWWN